jgi:hypothetical protein
MNSEWPLSLDPPLLPSSAANLHRTWQDSNCFLRAVKGLRLSSRPTTWLGAPFLASGPAQHFPRLLQIFFCLWFRLIYESYSSQTPLVSEQNCVSVRLTVLKVVRFSLVATSSIIASPSWPIYSSMCSKSIVSSSGAEEEEEVPGISTRPSIIN